MMSKISGMIILAVVCLGCWTIPGITGNPVESFEMERAFGRPLSKKELNCVPVFGKAAPDTPSSEGDDIVEVPNKNAMVNQKWPKPNEIPYVIDSTFDAKARCIIGFAMNQYHKNTCIRFVPRTNQKDYIQINKLDIEDFKCYSKGAGYYVGMGAHVLTFSPKCYESQAGTVIHELMHRVGFKHEHTRPDRDTYIEILWDQIAEDKKPQYQIAEGSSLLLSYDYGSVMHYPLNDQMKPKLDTNDVEIGQRNGFSELDINKLKAMYCPS